MPTIPLPPFLPESEEAFGKHVTTNIAVWYKYCREAYEYIERIGASLAEAQDQVLQSGHRTQALEREVGHLKSSNERLQGAREHQDEQLQKMTDRLVDALREGNQPVATPAPSLPQPTLSPSPPTETRPVTPTLVPTPARLSERLPDPEKFDGDRKDLRRFSSQIYEKMTVNRDRFPTTQSRMTYVTSRLSGQPYAQILPYIIKGTCRLSDYEAILELLDRAFGDPNRVNNARNELFRLRQGNKEFSTFFAEFQRLALEGEISEDSLPVLLEQAINRELRAMLLHHDPPNRQYHEFAQFLQQLENRRIYYENTSGPAPKSYASAARARPTFTPTTTPARPTGPPPPPPPTPQARDPDAMDLGYQRRQSSSPSTRRERGECFRCGSSTHLVRHCSLPDTRGMRTLGSARGSIPPSPETRTPETRTPSPESKSSSPTRSPPRKGRSLA